MTNTPTVNYINDFREELDNIDKLEQTPNLVREIAVDSLNRAISTSGIQTTAKGSLERCKEGLENIDNKSFENNFKIIYSQMCILAVSGLEATLKKYFENALSNFSNINQSNEELKKTKISLAELVGNHLKFSGEFGKLVLAKSNLNFQDLKSIKKIFSGFISKEIVLEPETEKKICFFLEARHILVHKGGVVDEKFIRATDSFNANIKNLKKGDRIEISTDDWSEIKNVLMELVKQTTQYNSEK